MTQVADQLQRSPDRAAGHLLERASDGLAGDDAQVFLVGPPAGGAGIARPPGAVLATSAVAHRPGPGFLGHPEATAAAEIAGLSFAAPDGVATTLCRCSVRSIFVGGMPSTPTPTCWTYARASPSNGMSVPRDAPRASGSSAGGRFWQSSGKEARKQESAPIQGLERLPADYWSNPRSQVWRRSGSSRSASVTGGSIACDIRVIAESEKKTSTLTARLPRGSRNRSLPPVTTLAAAWGPAAMTPGFRTPAKMKPPSPASSPPTPITVPGGDHPPRLRFAFRVAALSLR
jgi:hypothetical protein